MNDTHKATSEYAKACEALERSKIQGKSQDILDRLQEAIDYWKSRMVKSHGLDQEIDQVISTHSKAAKQ